MKKKVVFLAGPYRAYNENGELSINGIRKNIERIRDRVLQLAKEGIAVVCPNITYAFMDGDLTDYEDIIEQTKELLSRCDEVEMISGWHSSNGCRAEIEYAKELGIPVSYW